jgi:AcrR family transcriptional regulator
VHALTAEPRRNGLPEQQRSRDDVVRAAGRLFAERGFHGTSMRDLGNEVGLLGSSLYSHVSGKDELLVAVVSRGAALFQSLADAVLASDLDPPGQLAMLVEGHVAIVAANLPEARTILNEARFLPDDSRHAIVAMRDRYEAAVRVVIGRGVERGDFAVEDAGLAAILVLSVLNAFERWFRPDGERTPEDLAGEMYRFVLGGLR